jgi:hypothetical protein
LGAAVGAAEAAALSAAASSAGAPSAAVPAAPLESWVPPQAYKAAVTRPAVAVESRRRSVMEVSWAEKKKATLARLPGTMYPAGKA